LFAAAADGIGGVYVGGWKRFGSFIPFSGVWTAHYDSAGIETWNV
jgi:hypothetical protein